MKKTCLLLCLLLAACSAEGEIFLLDASSFRTLAVLEGHLGAVNQLAFSADGSLLASSSEDGTIRLWGLP